MVRSNEFNDFNNDIASCFDRDRLEHDLLEFYKFTSPHRPRWGDSGLFAYPHINVEDESVEFSIMSMNEDESMGNTTMNTFDREFMKPLSSSSSSISISSPGPLIRRRISAPGAPGQSISSRPFSPATCTLLSSVHSHSRPFSPASSTSIHLRRPYSRGGPAPAIRRPFSPDSLSRPRPGVTPSPSFVLAKVDTNRLSPKLSPSTRRTMDTTIDSLINHNHLRPGTAKSAGAGTSIRCLDDEFSGVSFMSGSSSIAELKLKKRMLERSFVSKYAIFPEVVQLGPKVVNKESKGIGLKENIRAGE